MDSDSKADGELHQPLNLASSFVIDPSLTATSDFFPDPHHVDTDTAGHDDVPTQEDIDAVIKASLDHARAHADAIVAQTAADVAIANEAGSSTSNDVPGTERNPIINPTIHLAPFSRPTRDEHTPCPEYFAFMNRAAFQHWLDAESSWCHFVQRRTTTPDKRSAERLQARIRAHNKQLESMTPEERAAANPLKTRRRKRVSPVLEKVTFTCHHAGSYEPKHSSTLPKEKLRLNTKKSVKCACASRIVLSELQDGECKVVYHWRHEGHDPYDDIDASGGRLPKSIDVWVNRQIEEGKTLDDIRVVLAMSDEDREAYLSKVAADPTAVDPSFPPPLALIQKIKYPDIYNRYRKLKGPVKENRPPKAATKRTASGTVKPGSRKKADTKQLDPNGNDDTPTDHGAKLTPGQADGQSSHLQGDDEVGTGEVDFSSLAPHEGLARALLDLPSGGLRDEDGNEMSLEEAMRRMAEGVVSVHDGLEIGMQ